MKRCIEVDTSLLKRVVTVAPGGKVAMTDKTVLVWAEDYVDDYHLGGFPPWCRSFRRGEIFSENDMIRIDYQEGVWRVSLRAEGLKAQEIGTNKEMSGRLVLIPSGGMEGEGVKIRVGKDPKTERTRMIETVTVTLLGNDNLT